MKMNYAKPELAEISAYDVTIAYGSSVSPCGGPSPSCVSPPIRSAATGKLGAPLVLDAQGNPVITQK